MHNVKGALVGSALFSATVSATPFIRSSLELVLRDDNTTEVCAWDPETPEAWTESGCGQFVDNWIIDKGSDNWLRQMDAELNVGDGDSTLNCDDINTNACPAPTGACNDWDNQPFYYIRAAASTTNSLFKFAHEKLQDEAILNLGSIDQMIQDFKADIPDQSWWDLLWRNIAGAAGLTGTFAALAIPGAGDVFAVLAAVIQIGVNNNAAPEAPDYDSLTAAIETYATDMFTNTNDALADILPALWGDNDSEKVDELYDMMSGSGLVPESSYANNIPKVFAGGGLMVPVLESDIASALENGIKDFQASVLGNLLGGLHYVVLGMPIQDQEVCGTTYGAQWLEESESGASAGCFYLLQRAPGESMSETVDQDRIDKMQGYGLDMVGLYDNVRHCNNANPEDTDLSSLYKGDSGMRYPPCFFAGMTYVECGGALDYPMDGNGWSNPDTVPSWVTDETDLWNDARDAFCAYGDNGDYPACQV